MSDRYPSTTEHLPARLRKWNGEVEWDDENEDLQGLMEEAADEIERLYDTVKRIATYHSNGAYAFDVWQLRTWAFEAEMAHIRAGQEPSRG